MSDHQKSNSSTMPVEQKIKPTKKDTVFQNRTLKDFNNMCSVIANCSPAFIINQIEELERVKVKLTSSSRKHIAEHALVIQEKHQDNPTVNLPDKWKTLVNFAD